MGSMNGSHVGYISLVPCGWVWSTQSVCRKVSFYCLGVKIHNWLPKLATSLWIVYVYEPLTVDHCEI